MSITIKHNKAPNLSQVKFTVDGKLDAKLDNIEIFKCMNKANFTLFLGKGGSGKSSKIISFLKSREGFKKIYHDIILFCPPNSRDSIKDDFWGKNLLPENIFDDLSMENLETAYSMAEQNAQEGYRTLIILDDVQKSLKGDNQKFLLHMVNNKRHASLSIWLACQNYKSIPPQIRAVITDMFIFKINKQEMEFIFEEHIEETKKKFEEILKLLFKNEHDFLYINTMSQRLFNNWDELII